MVLDKDLIIRLIIKLRRRLAFSGMVLDTYLLIQIMTVLLCDTKFQVCQQTFLSPTSVFDIDLDGNVLVVISDLVPSNVKGNGSYVTFEHDIKTID